MQPTKKAEIIAKLLEQIWDCFDTEERDILSATFLKLLASEQSVKNPTL